MKFHGMQVSLWLLPIIGSVLGKEEEKPGRPTVGDKWVMYPLKYSDLGDGYVMGVELGAHRKEVTVLFDTGSSDFWVLDPKNPYCADNKDKHDIFGENGELLHDYTLTLGDELVTVDPAFVASAGNPQPTMDCNKEDVYDPGDSISYKSNDTVLFDEYGIGFIFGEWGTDEVRIGNKTYQHLSVGIGSFGFNALGIMGVGLPSNEETTVQLFSDKPGYEYANFPIFLKDNGLTSSTAFSLFLNLDDVPHSRVIFGGVDHNRYDGTLYTVPLVSTPGNATSGNNTSVTQFSVELNGITLKTKNGSAVVTQNSSAVVLDSGTTEVYLNKDTAKAIFDSYGLPPIDNDEYVFPCSYFNDDDVLSFNFSGATMDVPMSNLYLESPGGSCQFLVQGGPIADNQIIGNVALQSSYLVYDSENLEISFAAANFTNTDTDIEPIDGHVPRAVRAPLYQASSNTTSGGSPTETSLSGSATSSSSVSGGSTNASSDSKSNNAVGHLGTMNSLLSHVSTALALVFLF